MNEPQLPVVTIEKLVHGGQGIGQLADGRKCFVWGALPSETVRVQLTKKKRDWCEGFAVEVLESSAARIEPREPEIYTATSPWQIADYEFEKTAKQAILAEAFEREKVAVTWDDFYQDNQEFGYRNKMEYNFWFHNDTEQVDLALHARGTHMKIAVKGSALALSEINAAGESLIAYINEHAIAARRLKSAMIRATQDGKVGVSLFVVDEAVVDAFADFTHQFESFEIIFSNPKSPASVATDVLVRQGSEYLSDTLLGRDFQYTTRSFFQVNIPVYEAALKEIATFAGEHADIDLIDMYSGVGSIGLSVVADGQHLTMIETERESSLQAERNMEGRTNCEVITATAESALEYLSGDKIVILDPPRAGLHSDVTNKLIETKPSRIIYLSCNPSTQARDVSLLVAGGYTITHAHGYNFFPRTPHIESLVVLDTVQ